MLPKLPRLTAEDAEKILAQNGYQNIRASGSHRIYQKGSKRFVVPFHKGKTLHPKIIKSLFELIEEEKN